MELKKNPNVDYKGKYVLFFNIGLVLSLLLVITAFEWESISTESVVDLDNYTITDELLLLPNTRHEPPPKPKPKQITLIEVPDDKEIDVDEVAFSFDIANDDVIEEVAFAPPPDEEVEIVHEMVETMPSFDGGIREFYKFVAENLKYPAQARRIGIEGKVFVQFIIDKDGSLSDIKVVRGIGGGCDEEVLRIVNMSPRWNPGKQRGVPVKVRMMLPISFKLK